MDQIQKNRISIQVSLSGYSFKCGSEGSMQSSGWLEPGSVFTTPELQRRYDEVGISLFTPKCTLVPEAFFDPAEAGKMLSEAVFSEGFVNAPVHTSFICFPPFISFIF